MPAFPRLLTTAGFTYPDHLEVTAEGVYVQHDAESFVSLYPWTSIVRVDFEAPAATADELPVAE